MPLSDNCNYFISTTFSITDISVISIGNSKVVPLSKTLLENYNIKDTVELVLEKSYIILKSQTTPRKGWEKSFKKMHESGDDALLIPESL